MEGIVEIDEMVIGQEEEDVKGRENDKKKLVIGGIEKKGKGISRMYAKVVKNGGRQAFKPFDNLLTRAVRHSPTSYKYNNRLSA